MPGVLIVEAMAQTAGCLATYTEGYGSKKSSEGKFYFASIDSAKFRKPKAGEILSLYIEKIRGRGIMEIFRNSKSNSSIVSECIFSAMIVDAGKYEKQLSSNVNYFNKSNIDRRVIGPNCVIGENVKIGKTANL